jgi:hypothetical protein
MGSKRSASRTNRKSCTDLECCLKFTPCKLQVTCLTGNVKRECKNHYVVTETAGLRRKLCILLLPSVSPVARLLMCVSQFMTKKLILSLQFIETKLGVVFVEL